MTPGDWLAVAAVGILTGLDRTAALQVMISRPIVAGPLTGWVLGAPETGLLVGMLVELLWLGRLPVGATIPPDDTQVAVGGTSLAVALGSSVAGSEAGLVIMCLAVAIPLGKVGQLFDRLARHWNTRLAHRAVTAVAAGRLREAERQHLWGVWHFALASLATLTVIVVVGAAILHLLVPGVGALFAAAAPPMRLCLPLTGVAVILGTINVSRMTTLFGASFASALIMLWMS